MAKYTGNVLTNKGKELLARAIVAGEVITFTKVEIGKGTVIGIKEELEALVESFKVLSITSTTELEGGSYRVRVAYNNAGVVVDTELREIGVFARGEDGIEILYSYCSTDSPDLIPAEASGTLERVEDIITYVSNATNINAVIDQSVVYATIKDLNDGLALKLDKGEGLSPEYGTGKKIEDKIENLSYVKVGNDDEGYIKWNDGRLECWGNRTTVTAEGKHFVSYPISFFSSPGEISFNLKQGYTFVNAEYNVVDAVRTDGFSFNLQGAQVSNGVSFRWRATGFWKQF